MKQEEPTERIKRIMKEARTEQSKSMTQENEARDRTNQENK